ncbi:MAG: hypothetical protein PW789_07895 [Edaphobacter sp.]|uniref:hypothetical protein n=1 Tax=Edaphobacter sp. TaxID=1934404 RepID=UPI0023A219CE|nr:hypothetical protein [Edaphobacter sp.]MDE1176515.1 hypothetical protein [Edaphobacter sp.]
MPVPSIIHGLIRQRKLAGLAMLAICLQFVTGEAAAKDSRAVLRIPLEPTGFEASQSQFLLAGGSMMTVDFIDDQHLLLTYNVKRLLKRLPDCPPSDQDREVDAVVLQLPDGKPVARASWRFHDRGQYLWRLGHGRFLLRNRNELWTLSPMINLASGNAFKQRPLIETKRRIAGLLVSPDADLMIVETLEAEKPRGLEEATGASSSQQTDESKERAEMPVQINFFSVIYGDADAVDLTPGEAARSRTPGRIPANSAGFLAMVDQGQQRWAFDFNTYDGKRLELSPFDSTCKPSPILVSRGEFIAFGCHTSRTPQVIGGFNMRGEEMWEQNMTESYLAPTFSYAPAAGRFAFSRMITHSNLTSDDSLSPEMIAGQNIIVYQTNTGAQLLHINATPVARAGQNFALSPDGMSLAVMRGDAIEVYPLPGLTGKDREAVQQAETSAPRLTGGARRPLSAALSSSSPENAAPAAAPSQAAPPSAAPAVPPGPSAAAVPAPAADSTPPLQSAPAGDEGNTVGDEQPRRKPPTLYNEPGEQPRGDRPE